MEAKENAKEIKKMLDNVLVLSHELNTSALNILTLLNKADAILLNCECEHCLNSRK